LHGVWGGQEEKVPENRIIRVWDVELEAEEPMREEETDWSDEDDEMDLE
jgi:hypothetical protein